MTLNPHFTHSLTLCVPPLTALPHVCLSGGWSAPPKHRQILGQIKTKGVNNNRRPLRGTGKADRSRNQLLSQSTRPKGVSLAILSTCKTEQ